MTMAHEIAHLLLPDASHSPSGIMRDSWTPSDYRKARFGQLFFTTDQARLMRDALAVIHSGSPPSMGCCVGNCMGALCPLLFAFKKQKPSAIISALGFWLW